MASRYLYSEIVTHKELNKCRVIKAETAFELEQKRRALMAQWNEQWSQKVEREARIHNIEYSLSYAAQVTYKAEEEQKALDSILLNSLNPQQLNIDKLKDHAPFSELYPKQPILESIPIVPQLSDAKYNQKPSFFTKISKTKLNSFLDNNKNMFNMDYSYWEKLKSDIEQRNDKLLRENNELVAEWNERKNAFLHKQSESNKKIDLFIEDYKLRKPEAIERYFTLVLEGINFPFDFSNSVDISYMEDGKMLVVDLVLPVIEDIPKLKSINYIKSKAEYKETYFTETYLKKKYDSVIYQIVLQTLNYIFTLDCNYSFIDVVVINGKINTIDKTTGKDISPYILSISVAKETFEDINLSAVDPKAWFKSAKGVSAATFANVTPVAPIVVVNKEDSRFIEGYAVANQLDVSINLATIDWQDFENLVREIFEQEFNSNGGEVKITQASRDGGVDAVAFDPDPIRGGKIVIQAKRYTNVVGVSAVRDLYGTVMNEGATKGILVTTSNYGNDAYEFAKGKPLTLMNGANLLYLLEKHGHKARIDIKEAKETLQGK